MPVVGDSVGTGGRGWLDGADMLCEEKEVFVTVSRQPSIFKSNNKTLVNSNNNDFITN